MRHANPIILLASASVLISCATVAPRELVDAREVYQRASHGNAADAAPAEVHVAGKALAKAEQSFEDAGDNYRTRDLAYVAQRKAQLAEATAAIKHQKAKKARSDAEYSETQGEIVDQTKGELDDTRKELLASQQDGAVTAAQLKAEQEARADADRRAAAALAKLGAVRDDERGMVITLSGSVLFASNKATLLPAARSRLEDVTDVLLEDPDRSLTVEGHTDSKGSDDYNMRLSQRRADAVRDAIVSRGYPRELVRTEGMGESHPVAENDSSTGRANNRRVEIVVARD